MGRQVIATQDVRIFLNELFTVLLEKHYFSCQNDAKRYVYRLTSYTKQYVGILPGKNAPPYFNRYGTNMKYIVYRANKTTSWYIFYLQRGELFLIRHITNNHVAAPYFE
jgi:hypothetical protein